MPTAAWQQVGWPALWFMLSAYLLLPAQRVLPPERIWLYKSWFCFVLLAVGLANWPWARGWRWVLRTGALVFACYQLKALLVDSQLRWLTVRQYQATHQPHPDHRPPPAYEWFTAHLDVIYPGARLAPSAPPPAKAAP